jgi:hypothetical protein
MDTNKGKEMGKRISIFRVVWFLENDDDLTLTQKEKVFTSKLKAVKYMSSLRGIKNLYSAAII